LGGDGTSRDWPGWPSKEEKVMMHHHKLLVLIVVMLGCKVKLIIYR
jgi:hypothetical protein